MNIVFIDADTIPHIPNFIKDNNIRRVKLSINTIQRRILLTLKFSISSYVQKYDGDMTVDTINKFIHKYEGTLYTKPTDPDIIKMEGSNMSKKSREITILNAEKNIRTYGYKFPSIDILTWIKFIGDRHKDLILKCDCPMILDAANNYFATNPAEKYHDCKIINGYVYLVDIHPCAYMHNIANNVVTNVILYNLTHDKQYLDQLINIIKRFGFTDNEIEKIFKRAIKL